MGDGGRKGEQSLGDAIAEIRGGLAGIRDMMAGGEDMIEAKIRKELEREKANAEAHNRTLVSSIERRMSSAGVPLRYLQGNVAAFPPQVVQGVLPGWMAGDGAVIFGPTGVGKTYLAAGLLRERLLASKYEVSLDPDGGVRPKVKPPIRARFITVPYLLAVVRGQMGKGDGDPFKILEEYIAVDCLVLDDLGAEKGSDWTLEVLYLLIDTRYANMRQTMVTSNLSGTKMAEQLSDRLASRVNGLGPRVELSGGDRRIRRQQEGGKR